MWRIIKMKKGPRLFKNIYSRILIPVMIIIFLQGIIISFFLFFGVTQKTLGSVLIRDFKVNVNLRRNYLETSIVNKWNNIDVDRNKIIENTKEFIEEKNITIDELLNDKKYSEELILMQADIIPDVIIKNQVTTCFLIIDNQDLPQDSKTAVFLNTKNPNMNTNDGIEVLFAPYSTTEYYHKSQFLLSTTAYSYKFSDIENKNFYYKPINYAKEAGKSKVEGYWSCDLSLENYKFLTYTIPLILNGKVIGAFGIGLTTQYLNSMISYINKDTKLNIELVRKVDDRYENAFKAYNDFSLVDFDRNQCKSTGIEGIYSFKNNNNVVEYVYDEELRLDGDEVYNESWYVVGILPKNDILSAETTIEKQVIVVITGGILFTFCALLVGIRLIINPIKKVSRNVSNQNLNNIPKTNIYEVDVLLNELSLYFEKAINLSKKLDNVIEDSSINIAILDYSKKDNVVNITNKFYSMLELDYDSMPTTKDEFLSRIKPIEKYIDYSLNEYEDFTEELFAKSNEYGILVKNTYLRLKIESSDEGAIATLLDFTAVYNEKKKIENERDYDPLTGLLNRTGLYIRVEKLISKHGKKGALYMIDIDNLKKINDNYGHDLGDKYINITGKYLSDLGKKHPNLLVSHLSGDEFILYLDNHRSMTEVNEIAKEIEKIREVYLEAYSDKIYISLSCGVALFEPNITFNELRKRADFAMYTIKKSNKNSVAFFNSEAYELYNMEKVMYEKLIKLIDEKLIDYAYQPIVDVKTGEVLGYEALMRPMLEEYRQPLKVIEAAKKYNRLYDIEVLTNFLATEKFVKSKCDKKLFINSISSQILSNELYDKYLKDFKDYLPNIVIEIIEEDFGENDIIDKKTSIIKKNGMNYAIDDYGTGFNNIGMVLDYSPAYIKIEGSLIREIDTDDKKKHFTKSIINFCKENEILVVAESVETIEEFKCVKELGVDYVQGYLLAKPSLHIVDLPDEIKKMIRES